MENEDGNDKQSSANEVTLWIQAIESGNDEAATNLWSYCFPKLLAYARRKLPTHLRRTLDEEDVALSTFKSFCLSSRKGAFPRLEDRDDLWKLLLCIASRKAQSYVRHENREKRGGGKVRGESIFILKEDSPAGQGSAGIGNVAGELVSPDMLAQFADDATSLLDMLQDDTIKTIAILRMEGYSVEEIAKRLDCGKRTIERRLNLIRQTWAETMKPSDFDESRQ